MAANPVGACWSTDSPPHPSPDARGHRSERQRPHELAGFLPMELIEAHHRTDPQQELPQRWAE
jgi:hypothetical protein